MIFVEKPGIPVQIRLEQSPQLLIVGIRLDQSVPNRDSSGVVIYDKDGPVQGVEQDGVGRLTPDASDRQKFRPQSLRGSVFETRQVAVVGGEEPVYKVLEPLCFDIEVAGGPYEFGKLLSWHAVKWIGIKAPCRLEIGYGFFHILPIGVLRQNGADNYLKPRLAGPPVLRAEGVVQQSVDFGQRFVSHSFNPIPSVWLLRCNDYCILGPVEVDSAIIRSRSLGIRGGTIEYL